MNTMTHTADISKTKLSENPLFEKLAKLVPIALVFLALRIDVAWQFYKAGLTKIAGVDWYFILPVFEINSSTHYLFESEYHVPFLQPETAALLAAYGELILPVFLFVGLAGRFSALLLFGLNVVAVISYFSGLWFTGLIDHLIWALFLLSLFAHGPGKISLDHLIKLVRQK